MKKKSSLIILYAPPASGKSTVLSFIKDNYSDVLVIGENITTRPMRNSELPWEHVFMESISENENYYKYMHAGWEYALDKNQINV